MNNNKKHSHNFLEDNQLIITEKSELNEKTKKITKKKSRKFIKFFAFLVVFFIVNFCVFFTQSLVSNQDSNSWFARFPIIKHIKHLAESADKKLKGEDQGRINIILLGMGGKNHQGGNLTDTIILASLEPQTKKVALMSIPRDMSIYIEDMGYRKINSVNAYAEANKKGSGGIAVSQAVSDVLNIPIDYYVRVDFTGFEKMIDKIGGLKIYVENDLEDYRYPISGNEENEDYESRFEHLDIKKGWQEMDGSLALKYARSRHAFGIEGSDFARAKRQQKIIEAVKDKFFSTQTLLNPKTVTGLISEFNNNISTNLKVWEIIKLWSVFKDINTDDIVNKVLDNSPNGLLVNSISENGAYILSPKSGDFAEIQYFVSNIFEDIPSEQKTKIVQERATIEIRNGTWINGLASKFAIDLEKYGFVVVRIGNSSRQNFQKSVIYDLSYGEKSKALEILKNKTSADVSYSMPDWLIDDISKELKYEKKPIQPDFILILGQDADDTDSGIENKLE